MSFFVVSKGDLFMGVKQLSVFEEVNEKEVRRIIAKELKQYRALKVAIQNKTERYQEGVEDLFPSFSRKEKEKELKVRQIDRALDNALDEIELQIIKQKYFSSTRVKDINLYLDMGLTKDRYYSHKRQAILLIATALDII